MPSTEKTSSEPSTGRKLLWFLGLWAAGVVSVAAFAYGVRAMLGL
ncbi:MAG: DUF2474 domain-containing protein [Rhizobiales bacterium]|nr:DUF2474 domain-containing protein [Hyphomicrobiales bacterium]